jgi:hypothetical protein
MISENACEVFMNDVMEEEYEINVGLQTKSSQNLENEKKKGNCKLKEECENHIIYMLGFFVCE